MSFWQGLVMRALFAYSLVFVTVAVIMAFKSLAEEMLRTIRRQS